MNFFKSHPLFQTLRELKGNPRITVLTEPLFGIPYNLYAPFLSVYMLALGVTDQWIGTIASLGLVFQIISAILSGAITDKFGRRATLFVTDLITWSVPCLIWAFAQNTTYFIVAAMINGLFRIAHTAWTCLLVEDAEERHVVHMWTWIMIFAVCSAFFSPLGGLIVQKVGLVPAMRGLLVFGSLTITAKAAILYIFSKETVRGVQRMKETRSSSIISLLGDYRSVIKQVFQSKAILGALALMVITNIFFTVNGSFWGVLFTSKLGFDNSQISLFVMLKSIVTTIGFFVIGPRLTNILHFRLPMWVGFAGYFASQALLVFMPAQSIPLLVLSIILEGAAASLVSPMTESLLAVAMETKERARISAVVYATLILFTSPFGWIAGQLSAINRSLPFVMNMGLFVIGALLVWFINGRPGGVSAQPALD
jgi:MFS family permease